MQNAAAAGAEVIDGADEGGEESGDGDGETFPKSLVGAKTFRRRRVRS